MKTSQDAPASASEAAWMLAADAARFELQAPLADFAQHGYARLGTALSDAGVQALRARADGLMQGEIRYAGLFYQHDSPSGRYADLSYGKGWVGPSDAYRKIEHLELDPLCLAWIGNPLFARVARAVLHEDVALYRAVLWNKAPHAGTELPWHQDDGKFWGIDRPPSLQIWTALDDAPEEAGCLEVVPGTHLQGLASPEGGTVQPGSLEAAQAAQRAVKLPAMAGEAILIHNHLWHRSGLNRTPAPRRALTFSYLHGDTNCRRKRRSPRTFMRVFG